MEAALADAIARIRAAAASGTRLRLRGGGSKDFYGEPAQGEVLDTRGLSGIRSYEPSELVVTVGAGTPLTVLEDALAQAGQELPFEPPRFGGATVGGMVATGISGPARASVGSVRDYVLGLTMVNGRGELLTFGGQVMKNVAGYDVSRLMAGSLGTLGLIVEVSLKVLPHAPAQATLRFELTQAEALKRLNAWGGRPLPLNASRWEAGTLWLRLRGARAAIEAACGSMGGERVDDASAQWDACREQQLPWFTARADRDLWRLSVPQTAPVLDLPEDPLVEWHGGQRWVAAAAGDAAHLRRAAEQAGGHATLFRPAQPATTGRFHPLTPALARIHRELRREFDPHGVFDGGRLFPDL
ncbi:glycolate oxidase subunit GlcE [Ramlibacter humi]|uniref:Glycolate oxidase subunit GlcE n=1 Tax=Ramlibacter humi TaxID=2530451 RepID=A0A4Z0BV20_9BURK|nr:glycolate oxidase subunit GlcE [Ramlibacter humi]TFZ01839.1 glycolate oxidase subunit GlcE [Ramlibacter humi]